MVLALIAGAYLYVFLTDPNHKMPRIKAVNIAQEEKKARFKNNESKTSEEVIEKDK